MSAGVSPTPFRGKAPGEIRIKALTRSFIVRRKTPRREPPERISREHHLIEIERIKNLTDEGGAFDRTVTLARVWSGQSVTQQIVTNHAMVGFQRGGPAIPGFKTVGKTVDQHDGRRVRWPFLPNADARTSDLNKPVVAAEISLLDRGRGYAPGRLPVNISPGEAQRITTTSSPEKKAFIIYSTRCAPCDPLPLARAFGEIDWPAVAMGVTLLWP